MAGCFPLLADITRFILVWWLASIYGIDHLLDMHFTRAPRLVWVCVLCLLYWWHKLVYLDWPVSLHVQVRWCFGNRCCCCLLQRICDQKFELFKFNCWLLCQSEPIVEVEFSFHIQSQAEEGIDQVHEASQKLASLDKALDHSDFWLIEESLPNLFELLFNLDFSWLLFFTNSP